VLPLRPPLIPLMPTLIPDRYIQLLKETREKGYRGRQQNYLPNPADGQAPGAGPEILTDYPVVQGGRGAAGSDKRRGNTIGFGEGGKGRF